MTQPCYTLSVPGKVRVAAWVRHVASDESPATKSRWYAHAEWIASHYVAAHLVMEMPAGDTRTGRQEVLHLDRRAHFEQRVAA